MRIKHYILLYFIFSYLVGFAGPGPGPGPGPEPEPRYGSNLFKIWQLVSYSGQASLRSSYREMSTNVNGITYRNAGADGFGSIEMRTKSYFVHPNFMEVLANGVYRPETSRSYELQAPTYIENRNTEGFDVSALFFKKNDFNANANASYYDALQNIAYITKIRTQTSRWGTGVNYRNKILPFALSYMQEKSKQFVIGGNSTFNVRDEVYQASANKSFSSHDNTSFLYVHNINNSNQTNPGLISTIYTNNVSDIASLNNTMQYEKGKTSVSLGSSVVDANQQGSYVYNRLYGQENLNFGFPRNFNLYNNYTWSILNQNNTEVYTQGLRSSATHQLYKSLHTTLTYYHNETRELLYNQYNNKFEADVRYNKNIPYGKLSMAYNFTKDYQNVTTPSTNLSIFREEHKLIDGQIILLQNPNVVLTSVVVRDSTNNFVYTENLDYILINQGGGYVEIQRVFGNPHNLRNYATVHIDYVYEHSGEYKYIGENNSFFASVLLFKNIWTTYYNVSRQRFSNMSSAETIPLNYFTQQTIGTKVDFHFIKAGVEYQYVTSNLMPYNATKGFISANKMYRNFYFTLTGNAAETRMPNQLANRQDYDASANISYNIFRNVNASANYMYRKMQQGPVSLDLQSSQLTVSGYFQQLTATISGQIYWTKNTANITDYRVIYIQLTRNF